MSRKCVFLYEHWRCVEQAKRSDKLIGFLKMQVCVSIPFVVSSNTYSSSIKHPKDLLFSPSLWNSFIIPLTTTTTFTVTCTPNNPSGPYNP